MAPDVRVGDTFRRTRLMTQEDFRRFADLSGDTNPIHVDPEFARSTHFGRTVSHGMLLYSMLCAFLVDLFPGAHQVRHEMVFPTGTPSGELVTFHVTVRTFAPGREVHMAVQVVRPEGELGLTGETWLRWPDGAADAAAPSPSPASAAGQAWGASGRRGPGSDLRRAAQARLELGLQATLERSFSLADRATYLELAGAGADSTPTVPPALIGGLFSNLLGTVLPGSGTNYLRQRMTCQRPAGYGEALTATVRVVRLRPEKGLVDLETLCTGETGDTVCSGEALVLAKERFARA